MTLRHGRHGYRALLIGGLLATVPSVPHAQSSLYIGVGPTKTPILASVLAPSGGAAAVLEESGLITVWSVEVGKRVASFPSGFPLPINTERGAPPMSMLHRRDDPAEQSVIAVGGSDGQVRAWFVREGRLILDAPHGAPDPARGRLGSVPVVDIDWTASSSLTACVSADGVFAEWSSEGPGKVTRIDRTTPNPGGAVHDIAVDRERGSTLFATAGGLYFEKSRSWKWALVDTSGAESDADLDARTTAGSDATVRRRAGVYPERALFAPGRELFASIWSNGEIRVYTTEALKRVRVVRLPDGSRPRVIAFSPDGTKLAAGGTGRTVYVWSLAPATPARAFTMPRGPVRSLWFAQQDGSLVAAVAGERYLRRIALPDTSTRFARAATGMGADTTTRDATSPLPYEPPVAARRAPTDPYAAAAAIDSTSVRVVGPTTRGIASAAFSPSGRFAAVLDDSGEVTIWDTRSLKRLSTFASEQRLPMNFIGGPPLAISDLPDVGLEGATVVTGDNAGYLRIRVGDGTGLRTVAHGANSRVGGRERDTAVIDVAITRGGMIISASERRLALWVPRGQTEMALGWLRESRGEEIRDIDASPDDSTIAVATAGGLYFVHTRTGAWSLVDTSGAESANEYHVRAMEQGGGRRSGLPPGRVQFSRDGRLVAVAYPTEIRVYTVATRERVHSFRFGGPIPGDLRRLAFSRDGRRLAATDANRIIMIWSLTDRTPPIALTTHSLIRSLTFAPNGRSLIVSGYSDRYLRALPIPSAR